MVAGANLSPALACPSPPRPSPSTLQHPRRTALPSLLYVASRPFHIRPSPSQRFGDENFKVRGSVATRQIAASYACEGSAMQIVLQLSSCHPLRTVDVECVQWVGVSDARWKKWQRT